MKSDAIKLVFTYLIALAILVGAYYALVISPYAVEADVKLWLTGAAGGAITFVFGEQVALRTARQQAAATAASVNTYPAPTVTASPGPPATVTIEPAGAPEG
jgi:hypothetical protein